MNEFPPLENLLLLEAFPLLCHSPFLHCMILLFLPHFDLSTISFMHCMILLFLPRYLLFLPRFYLSTISFIDCMFHLFLLHSRLFLRRFLLVILCPIWHMFYKRDINVPSRKAVCPLCPQEDT